MIPFIAPSDLNHALGKDVSSDEFAIIAVDSACQEIRTALGQVLNYVPNEHISLNGNGKTFLVLPQYPVVAVTAVSVEGGTLDSDAFLFDRSGLLFLADGSTWSKGLRNVEVTYSHGYATSEVDVEDNPSDDVPKPDRMPSDIRKVALELAARIFLGSGTGTDDVQENAQGPGPTSLTAQERADLSAYREVRAG